MADRIDPFVAHLKRARERCGLSMSEVAHRSKGAITVAQVSEWERGNHRPGIDKLRAWASVFGMKITIGAGSDG